MSVRFDFDGRVTLVTGASGALGSAVVDRLDAAGATVAAVDVVPPEDEDSLLDSDGVAFYRADLADERAVEETVTRIVDDHGRLDHLLNVAGTWRGGAPVESTPLETYRLLIDVNLTTAFLTTKHALPHLQETGGAVCSVSARSSLEGGEGDGPYRIARAGVRLLTESVAEENLGTVRANCVLPSVLDTPTNRETMAPSEEWVDPTDVATVMAFLCSAGASPTSGAAVPVYGEV
jgi:NAD(P)-dependent dehydrogenase (short-subunit alcohol dehydrogenase family)